MQAFFNINEDASQGKHRIGVQFKRPDGMAVAKKEQGAARDNLEKTGAVALERGLSP